jgi:hypothetical protein
VRNNKIYTPYHYHHWHRSFLSLRIGTSTLGTNRLMLRDDNTIPPSYCVKTLRMTATANSNEGDKDQQEGGNIIPPSAVTTANGLVVSSSSILDDNNDDNDTGMVRKVKGRKQRLVMGYQISAVQHTVLSIVQLLSLLSQSRIRGDGQHYSWPITVYNIFGGGLFTEGGVLFILKGAAIHDRLASDTYQRLNIAIIVSAILQQLVPLGGGSGDSIPITLFQKLVLKGPALIALIMCCKGYGYGVMGWDKSNYKRGGFMTNLMDGIQSTVKCMVNVKRKSFGYLLGTILVGSITVMKGWEVIVALLALSSSSSSVSSTILLSSSLSRLAKLYLLTSIFFTLKDAADRDRLKGTTFVQLNMISAAAFASMAVYYAFTHTPVIGGTVGNISSLSYTGGLATIKTGLTMTTPPVWGAIIGGVAMSAMALYHGVTNAMNETNDGIKKKINKRFY